MSLNMSLWAKFKTRDECHKFLRLALIFTCIVSVASLFHPLKDAVFISLAGVQWLPYARWVSLFCLLPTLLLYGKVVDILARHRMLYALCALGGTVVMFFIWMMYSNPSPLIGWAWYAFSEIFISLFVSLFWSFVSDISTPEDALQGYSIIVLGAQLGGVCAPLALYPFVAQGGPLLAMATIVIGLMIVACLVVWFMRVTPQSLLEGFCYKEAHKKTIQKTGFFEGLQLIMRNSYLVALAGIIALCDMIVIILEYHVKIKAAHIYTDHAQLLAFFFKLTMYANVVALFSLLLGVGAVGRWLGVGRSLLLLPVLVGVGVFVMNGTDQLWILMATIIALKGISYAVDKPTREQLYVPTSADVKYKAKSWIDTFGSRVSKGLGSSVHMLQPVLQSEFVYLSSLLCLGLIGVWIMTAVFIAKIHRKAVEGNKLVC